MGWQSMEVLSKFLQPLECAKIDQVQNEHIERFLFDLLSVLSVIQFILIVMLVISHTYEVWPENQDLLFVMFDPEYQKMSWDRSHFCGFGCDNYNYDLVANTSSFVA